MSPSNYNLLEKFIRNERRSRWLAVVSVAGFALVSTSVIYVAKIIRTGNKEVEKISGNNKSSNVQTQKMDTVIIVRTDTVIIHDTLRLSVKDDKFISARHLGKEKKDSLKEVIPDNSTLLVTEEERPVARKMPAETLVKDKGAGMQPALPVTDIQIIIHTNKVNKTAIGKLKWLLNKAVGWTLNYTVIPEETRTNCIAYYFDEDETVLKRLADAMAGTGFHADPKLYSAKGNPVCRKPGEFHIWLKDFN